MPTRKPVKLVDVGQVGPATEQPVVMHALAADLLRREETALAHAHADLLEWELRTVTKKNRADSHKVARRNVEKAETRCSAAQAMLTLMYANAYGRLHVLRDMPPDAAKSTLKASTVPGSLKTAVDAASDFEALVDRSSRVKAYPGKPYPNGQTLTVNDKPTGGTLTVGSVLVDSASGMPVCKTCLSIMPEARNLNDVYCSTGCQMDDPASV